MMMDNFDAINGICPVTQAVDRVSKEHWFIHIIHLVVSPSSPCYNFSVGFTKCLGLYFVWKTTKITKNKYSIAICHLGHSCGIKIDVLLRAVHYRSKVHACRAILQEARTVKLLTAQCQKKSSTIPPKGERCNKQQLWRTERGATIIVAQ